MFQYEDDAEYGLIEGFDDIDARELGSYIGFCSNSDDFSEEDWNV